MNWQAVFGPVTFTLEHLADVRTAAMEDPHVLLPRIKIGHFSDVDGVPTFVSIFKEMGDGAPSMGRVKNLRLENDGGVLVGDLVDVPWWVPAHYPSRSGEWDFGPDFKGVVTPGGKRYSCVLPAMALLGEAQPAISTLEDLERLIQDGPEAVAATSRRKPPKEPAAVTQAATRVNIDTVAKRFMSDVAQGDRYWWWPIGIYVDPDEIIADDDEGHLWRVPFATDGNDTVTFDEPVRVDFADVADPVATSEQGEPVKRRVYLPREATPAAVATSLLERQRQEPLRTFTSAAQVRPADRAVRPATAAVARPDNERTPMDTSVLKALARQHGLDPDTATEEQVNAKVIEAAQAAVETPETPEVAETPAAEVESPEEMVAASTTQIDPETLRAMQAEIAASRADREKRERQDRDRIIATAVGEGRIPPARVEHYATAWEKDADGTRILLTASESDGGLAKGLVPVTERGAVPDADSPVVDDATHQAYMAAHFPAVARSRGLTTTTGA